MEMLKIASSGLGMAPAQAMRIAEGLYTSGYLSYPRTGDLDLSNHSADSSQTNLSGKPVSWCSQRAS